MITYEIVIINSALFRWVGPGKMSLVLVVSCLFNQGLCSTYFKLDIFIDVKCLFEEVYKKPQ